MIGNHYKRVKVEERGENEGWERRGAKSGKEERQWEKKKEVEMSTGNRCSRGEMVRNKLRETMDDERKD